MSTEATYRIVYADDAGEFTTRHALPWSLVLFVVRDTLAEGDYRPVRVERVV